MFSNSQDHDSSSFLELSHLFPEPDARTGAAVGEYAVIEETIAPAALKVIGDWVVEQVKDR